MTKTNDPSRRAVLAATTLLSLATSPVACAQADNTDPKPASTTLVAYFTRSGNTRVIAETLGRALGTALFQIRPARPYPEDYEETVEKARQERDGDIEPLLAGNVPNMSAYDTLFLGFPIWGETAPPVIRSFLRAHDLKGKAIRPFITHGGYGSGNSMSVLSTHAPGARIEPPFVLEGDQERRTIDRVNSWLGKS